MSRRRCSLIIGMAFSAVLLVPSHTDADHYIAEVPVETSEKPYIPLSELLLLLGALSCEL